MTAAVCATTWTVRFRGGLRSVCAAGIAAAVLAAGWGSTVPGELGRLHASQVVELEATLAASVVSTAAEAVAPAPTSVIANSIGTKQSPASVVVALPEPVYSFAQGLVIAGAAALLTPAWYLGFPVTLTGSAAFLFVLMRPFVAAAAGTMTPVLTATAVALGALIYALLPPALIVAGLVQAGSAVSRALSLPAAAPSAARVARARDVQAGTGRSGRSGRDTATPRTQSANAAPSSTAPTAAAVPAKGRHSSPTAAASSKKSKGTGGATRAVGGSGRSR